MVSISDLSCTNRQGKPIYGTAAILHRLFGKEDSGFDREAELKKYRKIIQECGYYDYDE